MIQPTQNYSSKAYLLFGPRKAPWAVNGVCSARWNDVDQLQEFSAFYTEEALGPTWLHIVNEVMILLRMTWKSHSALRLSLLVVAGEFKKDRKN